MTAHTYESHTVRAYDNDLKSLIGSIKSMADHVDDMIGLMREAIATQNVDLLEKARDKDKKIGALEQKVEQQAFSVLALRQPMAIDLRFAASTLKVASILERMGDLAKNATSKLVREKGVIPGSVAKDLDKMSEHVAKMTKNAVKGLDRFDVEKADKVWKREDKVDDYYFAIIRALEKEMMTNPQVVPFCLNLVFAAKGIERMGDYATRVTKIVHFVTGDDGDGRKPAEPAKPE